MSCTYVVTGTDTGVGKTVFASALCQALNARYWKPIQAGLEDGGDSSQVAVATQTAPERILPEAYRLTTPCSPHRSAEIDGIEVDIDRLKLPGGTTPLVIEGAGGALVPLTRDVVYADLFALWQQPVIIVARTALGTINHCLLTIEALRARSVPIHGIAFVGDAFEDNEEIVPQLGGVRRLGRLPWLPALDPANLAKAFAANFDIGDFR